MKQIEHEILSELHRILSIAEPHELRGASTLPSLSPDLRDALKALARERSNTTSEHIESEEQYQGETPQPVDSGRHRGTGRQRQSLNSKLAVPEHKHIYDVLMKSPKFNSKAEMLVIAKSFGLQVAIRTKDSRKDAARKLATAILSASDAMMRKALAAIFEGQDFQTQGWIDVIKSSG